MLPARGTRRTLPLRSSQLLSNGLDSIFVIFCLLEFCTAVAALAFGYNAVKQHNYTRMVRGAGVAPKIARASRFLSSGSLWWGGSLLTTPKAGFSSLFPLPGAVAGGQARSHRVTNHWTPQPRCRSPGKPPWGLTVELAAGVGLPAPALGLWPPIKASPLL